MLAGGDSGPVVRPGHPAESMLRSMVKMVNACRRLVKSLKPDQVKLIKHGFLRLQTPLRLFHRPADHWAF